MQARSSLTSVAEGDQRDQDDQRESDGGRDPQLGKRNRRCRNALRIGGGARAGPPLLDLAPERLQRSGQFRRPLVNHQVPVLAHQQITLRDQAVMLPRGGGRHQYVVATVHIEGRQGDARQEAAQRTLIGVVKTARVGRVQHRAIQRAHVRHQFVQQPQAAELKSVQGVIEPVVAEQFQLLHADGGHERQRRHALGVVVL
jgi:hypothetical protein